MAPCMHNRVFTRSVAFPVKKPLGCNVVCINVFLTMPVYFDGLLEMNNAR